ncbi:hypothetical protein ACOME3_005861 [Neoechinorhynchus agilis]
MVDKKAVVEKVSQFEALLQPLRANGQFLSAKNSIDHPNWFHQDQLETVIPSIGRLVKIVNGAYCDSVATLTKVNRLNYSANVVISHGPLNGRKVENLPFEDISKLYHDESFERSWK